MSQHRKDSEVAAEPEQPNAVTAPAPPPNLTVLDGLWKFSRYYGSFRAEKYPFPVDAEELNRLDIFHKFFLVAREDKIFSRPLSQDRTPKILDLGTGTGIWAITAAEDYEPRAEILAVDLHLIQPKLIPPQMRAMQFDIEEPSWNCLTWDCDLIHMRTLIGSVQTDLWPQVYRNIFEHLAPGTGYFEQVEIDWTPRWADDDVPRKSVLKEWSDMFLSGLDELDRSGRLIPEERERMMETAGFTDFEEQIIRVYVNPWSSDAQARNIARWFNIGFSHGIEAMSIKPFSVKLDLREIEVIDYVRELASRVRSEICILRYHAYFNLHVWTAKRPSLARK